MRKFAGWILLLAVLGGLFVATGISAGWWMAALAWGAGIAGAALVVLAMHLIV